MGVKRLFRGPRKQNAAPHGPPRGGPRPRHHTPRHVLRSARHPRSRRRCPPTLPPPSPVSLQQPPKAQDGAQDGGGLGGGGQGGVPEPRRGGPEERSRRDGGAGIHLSTCLASVPCGHALASSESLLKVQVARRHCVGGQVSSQRTGVSAHLLLPSHQMCPVSSSSR